MILLYPSFPQSNLHCTGLSLKVVRDMGTPECVFGMRDLGTRDLGCGEACMVGRGDVGCGDAGMWGLEDMGSRGRQFGDGALSRTGMRDEGRGEVRNKRNHFLLQINVKYNFQRIKGRSLSEVSRDDLYQTWQPNEFQIGNSKPQSCQSWES